MPGARGRREEQAHRLGLKQLEPDPWTLFTEKYKPGDKIGGKVRSITDYGVFIGIEEGVDGMVHKSDISWTAKVNNPTRPLPEGRRRRGHHPQHQPRREEGLLGVKQLWDDPWPTIFNELPPGKLVKAKVVSASSTTASSCSVRDGVEGLIPQNELVLVEGRDGRGGRSQDRRRGRGGDRQHRHAGAAPHARRCAWARRQPTAASDGERQGARRAQSKAPKKARRPRRRPAARSGSSSSRSSARSSVRCTPRRQGDDEDDDEYEDALSVELTRRRRSRRGRRLFRFSGVSSRRMSSEASLGALADGVHPRSEGPGTCIFCDLAAAPPGRSARTARARRRSRTRSSA